MWKIFILKGSGLWWGLEISWAIGEIISAADIHNGVLVYPILCLINEMGKSEKLLFTIFVKNSIL